jgi:hypothetical protein
MRPNLTFGPIDSLTQYLLYLSIVVLGVVLPLLVQKWRVRRERAQLLARTVTALDEELRANRRRVVGSRATFVNLKAVLELQLLHYRALRDRVLRDGAAATGLVPAEDGNNDMNVPLITSTAWDVARLATALPLLPTHRLSAYTRAYEMQRLFARDRSMLMDTAMQAEVLQLPAQLSQLPVIDERLKSLTLAHNVFRYHIGLADGMITAYDVALQEAPDETIKVAAA